MKPLQYTLALLLAGAPQVGGVAAATTAGRTTPRLTALLTPKTVGRQLATFERIAGPAKYVEANTRSYDVDGCAIGIALDRDSTIRRLGVRASRTCRPPLAAMFGQGLPPLGVATFDDFRKGGWGRPRYEALCSFDCGNSTDPFVYALWGPTRQAGPAAIAEVRIDDDRSIAAHLRWHRAVEGAGDAYMQEERFNTDPRSQAVARRQFSNIRVTGVALAVPPHDPKGLDSTFPGFARMNWEDPPMPKGAHTTPRLTTLASAETLGVRLAWFESRAGRPFRIAGRSRTYRVDGCELNLTVAPDGDVDSIGLAASRTCRVPLHRMLLQKSLGVARFSDAIANWGEPHVELAAAGRRVTVNASWRGSHVHNYDDLSAEGQIELDPLVYDTPAKREAAVRRALGNIRVTRVTLRPQDLSWLPKPPTVTRPRSSH